MSMSGNGLYTWQEQHDLQKEIKNWQKLAGEFASLANYMASQLIAASPKGSADIDEANDAIERVQPYLIFDEREDQD